LTSYTSPDEKEDFLKKFSTPNKYPQQLKRAALKSRQSSQELWAEIMFHRVLRVKVLNEMYGMKMKRMPKNNENDEEKQMGLPIIETPRMKALLLASRE
jgi:hypothetical protein